MFKILEDIAISLHVASPHKKEKRKVSMDTQIELTC